MSTFVQARNFTRGRITPLRVVVWHDMEAPENATTAEAVAAYFAGPNAPQASAHLCVDVDSSVECVKPEDTAWHAPGANADGYGVELAGYARQTAAEWEDAYSLQTLRNAAGAVAPVMKAHGIPAKWLTDAELANGQTKGMTTHAQVSRVFRKSDHTDPGTGFPAALLLAEVVRQLGGTPAIAKPKPTIPPFPGTTSPSSRVSGATRAFQQRLHDRGWVITVDGVHGPGTTDVLKAFQKQAGLAQDGIGGPATWSKLWTLVVTP